MTQQTILLIAGVGLLLFGLITGWPKFWAWIKRLFAKAPEPPAPVTPTRQAYVAAWETLRPILPPEVAASVWTAIGAPEKVARWQVTTNFTGAPTVEVKP